MRILKALTLVAVAGALAAGSAQAQATGWFNWVGITSTPSYNYTIGTTTKNGLALSPYRARVNLAPYTGSAWMPPSGPQWTGPAFDIFCVDFQHWAQTTPAYEAKFTNLGTLGTVASLVPTTTRKHQLQQYLMAAYLSSELSKYTTRTTSNDVVRGDIQGAIWKVMTGEGYSSATFASRNSLTAGIEDWATRAADNYRNVSANEWVVITANTAVGTNVAGPQEFMAHVTPEPATLLLLGTGLLTLMAAGVLRRSAV